MTQRRRLGLRAVLPLALLACASCAWARKASDPHTVVCTLELDGRERSYRLHVPPDLDPRKPAPLVLMFHGGGGEAKGTEAMCGFSPLSDREGFVVAYPDGIGRNWNDGREDPISEAHRKKIDDVAFVAAMIDAIDRAQRIDAARVYATGISNGAIFSHYLAIRMASRIAAIAPVVGGMAEAMRGKFRPARPVSVLVIQGTEDPLVPYDGGGIAGGKRGRIVSTGEALRLWSEHDGCRAEGATTELPDRDPKDGCRVVRTVWSGGAEGTEVALVRIEGGGHTWPNGTQYLPEAWIGVVCRDFGCELIWEFFRAHARPM